MSEEKCEALEVAEAQAIRDLKAGIRQRKVWARILVLGKRHNLTEAQLLGFINGGKLFANDADRAALAQKLGFDWEGAADFFAEIMPIIIEMMAMCGL